MSRGSGPARAGRPPLELVLVGGGHAHVQVLRSLAMRPLPGVRVSVVLDRPEAVYSGMVPAFVAGDCRIDELEIDVHPLARRAGARVIVAAAQAVDPEARRIALAGRPPLAWDLASLDVGSRVRGLAQPGVAEHALATRPIRDFVDRLERRLEDARRAAGPRPLQVLVAGGGAAGVELAFTLEARLRAQAVPFRLALAGDALLPGASARMRQAARREAARRGITLHAGARVVAVEKRSARVEGPEGPARLEADLVVWATGAEPPPLLEHSPLPRDAAGFVRVDATLQVLGVPGLFAAGDCAVLEGHPWVPRAGVYAVRQGPVLTRNLRAAARGARLARYRPQRDFLSLLHLGDGRALGGKWGWTASGRAVAWLKDRIDRRFVRRFRVLEPDGAPGPGLPEPEAMGMAPMACGGCAAKLPPDALHAALARLPPSAPDPDVVLGLAAADDAAALRTAAGGLRLATVDGFRAFTDDAFVAGRVAALNALSDVFAKGGAPRHALALVTLAEDGPDPEETLFQALAGVRAALDAHGVTLLGGHSTLGESLFVALAVDGGLETPEALRPLAAARPGDRLLLTKPLGSGVLLAADAQGLARGAWMQALAAVLLRSNAEASCVAHAHGVRAATDVTGFGLAGHLDGMLRASGVAARVELAALPVLPGALALLARGVRSTYHPAPSARPPLRDVEGAAVGRPEVELLFDPQTAGGLLLAAPAARAEATLAALRTAGDAEAAAIGEVTPARSGAPRIELVAGPHAGRRAG